MVAHVVLYRPRPDAAAEDLSRLVQAISAAAAGIDHVRRFWVGRSVPDPPRYKIGGFPAFPFCAVIEFDDRAGLQAYLDHEAHGELSRLFNLTTEAALIYDFEIAEAGGAETLLGDLLGS